MRATGNLYQHVISSALRVVEVTGKLPADIQGLSAVSGLDDNRIRESFPTSEALRDALLEHGVVVLGDAMRAAIVAADPADPRAQLQALARGYFSWGAQNRALFALLSEALVDPSLPPDNVLERQSLSLRELIRRKLRQCQGLGLLDPSVDLDLLLANIHSQLLGLGMMVMQGRKDSWYGPDCADSGELAIRAGDQFINLVMPSARA